MVNIIVVSDGLILSVLFKIFVFLFMYVMSMVSDMNEYSVDAKILFSVSSVRFVMSFKEIIIGECFCLCVN